MGGGEESSILSLSTVASSQGSHAWPADSSSVFCFGTNANGVCSGRTQLCYCQQLHAHFSHRLCCSFQAPVGLLLLLKNTLKQPKSSKHHTVIGEEPPTRHLWGFPHLPHPHPPLLHHTNMELGRGSQVLPSPWRRVCHC